MASMTKQEIREMLESAIAAGKVRRYKKIAKVLWRHAIPGETVITTCGGRVETVRTISTEDSGDTVVVMSIQVGTSAEQYIISDAEEKFFPRYTITGEAYAINGMRWWLVLGKGEVEGFCYEGEPGEECVEDIIFEAPWGEDMLLINGDMLVRIPGSGDDIYRIARGEFDSTYIERR